MKIPPVLELGDLVITDEAVAYSRTILADNSGNPVLGRKGMKKPPPNTIGIVLGKNSRLNDSGNVCVYYYIFLAGSMTYISPEFLAKVEFDKTT